MKSKREPLAIVRMYLTQTNPKKRNRSGAPDAPELENTMQTDLNFPVSLAEKYRPTKVCDFIGLEKPRKIIAKFSENPKSCAFLFVGPSGTGKLSLALAL